MVAVVIVLFVALALAGGAYMVAVRGKGDPGKLLYSQKRGASAIINVVLAITYVGFGIVLPLLILTGNHSNASAHVGNVKLTTNEKIGREQFGVHCSICHTLASANAIGKVGPNLDQIKPSDETVLHTIENGCLPNPSASEENEACLGYGVMPANVVQSQDARDVAAYVAAVAGKNK